MSVTSASARHAPPPPPPMSAATGGHGGPSGSAGVTSAATTQSGPPYFCPTCQTSYSRLEYLRRHERRHADIRPFVCDCGKGFSRSDVLSRHKRQCAVVLNGGEGSAGNDTIGDVSNASNKSSSTNGGAGANKRRASSSNNAAQRRKSSTSRGGKAAAGTGAAAGRKSRARQADPLHPSAGDDDDDEDDAVGSHSPPPHFASHPPPHHHHQHSHLHPGLNSSTSSANSFPFPPQPGVVHQGSSVPPPLLPPAPYGTDGNMMGGGAGGGGNGVGPGIGGANHPGQSGITSASAQTNNSPFGGMMSHHLSAFNNLVNQSHHHYPSSPESNGTLSQHGSPRFGARDMARHGSNGSRTFSLRKGGSFDHIGPRHSGGGGGGVMPGTTPNQYAPEFWDALDPAAKNATSMAGSDYMTAGGGPGSLGELGGVGGTSGLNGGGVTTPRGGEPQRFSVSTGPLSPFSSIALSSTMSPYLSAFSNARDTPFVASPSRGLIPGTPGSSLNVFDWTMRPPSKPASSTMAKRDSLSQQGGVSGGSSSAGGASSTNGWQSGSGSATAASTSTTNTSPSSLGNKRKRDDDDSASRSSPKVEDVIDSQTLDDDHRSAAELLDSLRTAGVRPAVHTPGATDATSSVAPMLGSIPAPMPGSTASASEPGTSAPMIVSSAVDDGSSASALAAVSAAADAEAIHAISEGANHSGSMIAPASSVAADVQTVTAGPLHDNADARGNEHRSTAGTNGATKEESSRRSSSNESLPVSTTLPPPHNLTLSQLPPASSTAKSPASAASLAQSSWEALMKENEAERGDVGDSGREWTKGLHSGKKNDDEAVGGAKEAAAGTAAAKLSTQPSAQTVGDDARA